MPRSAVLITLAVVFIAIIAYAAYRYTHPPLPRPGTPLYDSTVTDFYTGQLALNVGDDQQAETRLNAAALLAPAEPAIWADLGLYYMRHDNFDSAKPALDKAVKLAPDDPQVVSLAGLFKQAQGDYTGAAADFQHVIQRDPNNVRARYTLVQILAQQASPDADVESTKQLQAILAVQPDNLVTQIDLAELAARTGDTSLLRSTVKDISKTPGLDTDANASLQNVIKAASGESPRTAATKLIFLRNLLTPTAQYQTDQHALQNSISETGIAAVIGIPIDRFLLLPSPPSQPAPPDRRMQFVAQALLPAAKPNQWTWARSAYLDKSSPASTILANGNTVEIDSTSGGKVQLPFPGGAKSVSPGPDGILPIDWNGDFKLGLVLAGAGGLRIYRQAPATGNSTPQFLDVTRKTTLPADIVGGSYLGAWAADIDSDGDLDIVLGTKTGSPIVLRNNSNGTFTAVHPFPGASDGLTDFAWGDLDHDGDPDAAFVDGTGRLQVFQNRLSGVFQGWDQPVGIGNPVALSIADYDRSGRFSLVTMSRDGRIMACSRTGSSWTVSQLIVSSVNGTDPQARLEWADLDNNGGLDLIATNTSYTEVFLSDGSSALQPLMTVPEARLVTIDPKDTTGRLDLIGISNTGTPIRLVNNGSTNYHWQDLRLQAAQVADRRNNSFGIGGFEELRSGLLYDEQYVTGPVIHFGLGTYDVADAVRITWPNGVTQGEFELKPNQVADAPERLKGSCPWLFGWNGKKMAFITDFLWRSALGLRINGQNTAGVIMTGDWNKISGSQLAPHDGYYDLRLDTQLWETYYFDTISMMTVDHPANTDIWVDERFSIPPPKLAYVVTDHPHPIVHATDDLGSDVTRALAARDGNYLDTFGRGPYQGITRDHWVEVDLGSDFPAATKQQKYLLCNGWIHPTDSSVNMAISQGAHVRPYGIDVEAPDGHGGWRTALPNFGFPEGKFKTILIPLNGLFPPGAPHKLRLRTNLEIYWDWIAWAQEMPNTATHSERIQPSVANLRYHGFNVIDKANLSSPDIPDYDRLGQTTQRWLDMTGYYTRYGDVSPLLAKVDDRYIIMNAGDELALRFPAPSPPAQGWTRDYILTADGWGKDCDHNSGFSKTVLPLPYHADRFYTRQAGRLQDEPAYRMHPEDWVNYQTRYVTPQSFQEALKP